MGRAGERTAAADRVRRADPERAVCILQRATKEKGSRQRTIETRSANGNSLSYRWSYIRTPQASDLQQTRTGQRPTQQGFNRRPGAL